MDTIQMLMSIQKRMNSPLDLTGRGIGLAASYFAASEVGPDGAALSDPWKLAGVDKRKWAKAKKEVANRLVYRDDGMVVTGGASGGGDREVKLFGVPKRKDASILTTDSIMDFEGVATSRKKDRDGDVIEPRGAEFDPKMPLLLHHNPTLPVGKMVAVVSQDDDLAVCHFAIKNNQLGQDTAGLVEFGAFRLSIGFSPVLFKAMDEANDDFDSDGSNGFHIEKCYVMETSCVTIPANVDAIITQYSRAKLHSAYLKKWSETFFDARPVVVKSGYDPVTGAVAPNVNVTVNINHEKAADVPVKETEVPAKKEAEPEKKPEDEKPGDEKPKEDEKPTDSVKTENPSVSDIEDSLKAISGEGLPEEAADRIATVTNMLARTSTAMDEFTATAGEALEKGDLSGIMDAVGGQVASITGCLARMNNELEVMKTIEGMPESSMGAIGDAQEMIGMVSAGYEGLMGKDDGVEARAEPETEVNPDAEEKAGDEQWTCRGCEFTCGSQQEAVQHNAETGHELYEGPIAWDNSADEDLEEKTEYESCSVCSGYGEMPNGDECTGCNGSGVVAKTDADLEEKEQVITSEPAYGEEIAADDDGLTEWEGKEFTGAYIQEDANGDNWIVDSNGNRISGPYEAAQAVRALIEYEADKSADVLCSKLIGHLTIGSTVDAGTLMMVKDAVESRLEAVANEAIEKAMQAA